MTAVVASGSIEYNPTGFSQIKENEYKCLHEDCKNSTKLYAKMGISEIRNAK
jgi:hypothetical protein